MKRFDVVVLTAAVGLVMGGAGFALDHFTAAKTTAAAAAPGQSAGGAGSGFGSTGGSARRGGFGRGVRGTVSAVSGNTLTVAGSDGSTHTVDVSSSTTYSSGAGGSANLSDVTTGVTILAAGQTASDGAVTATRVIINPPAPGNFGGGAGGGSGVTPAN